MELTGRQLMFVGKIRRQENDKFRMVHEIIKINEEISIHLEGTHINHILLQ